MTSEQTPGTPTQNLPAAMQALYPARRRSLAGMWWAVCTLLHKKRIYWEDRLGLFHYQNWIMTVEQPALQALLAEAKRITGPQLAPIFVVDCDQASRAQVQITVRSLQQLEETHWSLVLLLSHNSSRIQEDWLHDLLTSEPRVCLIQMDPINSGWQNNIAAQPGDWVIPLRAGDRIVSTWPSIFRLFLERYPQADIFYWDEDQYVPGKTGAGSRCQPFFKPGWSPELLISVNFLESAAFRKSFLRDSQDRFASAFSAKQIARIPVILQHRPRLSKEEGEVARAQHAGAVRSYLESLGLEDVTAGFDARGNLRARWQIDAPLVSIIIPTRENLGYLRRCLTSLLERTEGVPYEIILMDDHSSSPEVLEYYRTLQAQYDNIRVYNNQEAFNYSRVNNQGAQHARGSMLLFLNNDVEILDGDWLAEMARWALLPGVGMAGARLLYPDRSIQHAGIVLGMTGHAGHLYAGTLPFETNLFLSPDVYRNVSAVTGACMLVRREVFEQVGGFDEELILVFNDVDLCLRVQEAGWRVVYTPAAALIHYEGRSRSRYMPPRDLRRGAERLLNIIEQGDPFYHPNLSLSVNWPSFRRGWEPGAVRRLNDILRYKG